MRSPHDVSASAAPASPALSLRWFAISFGIVLAIAAAVGGMAAAARRRAQQPAALPPCLLAPRPRCPRFGCRLWEARPNLRRPQPLPQPRRPRRQARPARRPRPAQCPPAARPCSRPTTSGTRVLTRCPRTKAQTPTSTASARTVGCIPILAPGFGMANRWASRMPSCPARNPR